MNSEKLQKLFSLLGTQFKAHPWHGISAGDKAPEIVRCYIETVPGDQMKFEICKKTGFRMIDRPNKYSSNLPVMYGFIPQTYCAEQVANYCMEQTGRTGIEGDGDPLDVVVLTDRPVTDAEILLDAIVIGGFRMIDGGEADDKIIAVLKGDQTYGDIQEANEAPEKLIKRIKHYFLSYKEDPDQDNNGNKEVEITHLYSRAEALEVIRCAQADYEKHYGDIRQKTVKILEDLLD